MQTLITGANGHIGCHVTRAVAARGWHPIAFVRDGCDERGLAGLEVQRRVGDLLDRESLERAMQGVELVMHVGAVHRNVAADPAAITEPATRGTENVLEAAKRAGVRRVVYTSTAATVGFAPDVRSPLDEDARLEQAKSAYARGKIEAERVAQRVADAGEGLEVVILNPSVVLGPRDYRITPATRAIIGLLQGDPLFMAICPTHVEDVATAHVLAAEHGVAGQRYITTASNLPAATAAALIGELAGKRPATVRPPQFLLKLLVGLNERKAIGKGEDAAASTDAIDDLGRGHLAYDATRSRVELGASYRPALHTLRDTMRWLLFIDALEPKVATRVRQTLGATAAAAGADWVL